MLKPMITSMRLSSAPERKKPKTGDRRTTKKHGEQVRLPDSVDGLRFSARYVSNGRQLYSWVSKERAIERGYGYLFEKEGA